MTRAISQYYSTLVTFPTCNLPRQPIGQGLTFDLTGTHPARVDFSLSLHLPQYFQEGILTILHFTFTNTIPQTGSPPLPNNNKPPRFNYTSSIFSLMVKFGPSVSAIWSKKIGRPDSALRTPPFKTALMSIFLVFQKFGYFGSKLSGSTVC